MTTPIDQTKLLETMRQGVNYEIPIKVRGFEFMARPLSVGEQNRAITKAQEMISNQSELEKTTFSEAAILAQCYLIPASRPYDGKDIDERVSVYLLDRATPEELQYMYKQYCSIVDKCNPSFELLSAESLKSLADSLKKKKPEELVSALTELYFKDLVSVCHHLLIESISLQMGN